MKRELKVTTFGSRPLGIAQYESHEERIERFAGTAGEVGAPLWRIS
jgi:hypothetical protein